MLEYLLEIYIYIYHLCAILILLTLLRMIVGNKDRVLIVEKDFHLILVDCLKNRNVVNQDMEMM